MMTYKESAQVEELAEVVQPGLDSDYEKKDLKEMRRVMKEMLYDGSKKLKHSVPKGRRI